MSPWSAAFVFHPSQKASGVPSTAVSNAGIRYVEEPSVPAR